MKKVKKIAGIFFVTVLSFGIGIFSAGCGSTGEVSDSESSLSESVPDDSPTHICAWGEWEIYKPAQNCQEKTVEKRTCKDNSEHFELRETKPGAHSYRNGICEFCGREEPKDLEYIRSGETYQVSGCGENTDAELCIPETYKGLPVTGIERNAFYKNDYITSIIFPDSLATIGSAAFAGCSALTELEFGSGALTVHSEAFLRCTALKTLFLPKTIVKLQGNGVFRECTALESVVFEENGILKDISNSTFYRCTALKSVEFGQNCPLENIGASAFQGCASLGEISLPDSLKYVNYGAFEDCESLKKVEFPASLQTLSSHAFYNCKSLRAIEIPAATTSINHNAFTGCDDLMSIVVSAGNPVYHSSGNCIIETNAKKLLIGCTGSTFPQDDSVTEIGSWAFGENSRLRKIEISPYIAKIDIMSFADCGGLESIVVDKNNKYFHSANNCLIETEQEKLIRGCTTSVIPTDGSVTQIQDGAFSNSKIKNVYIPACVISIGKSAFDGCTELESIVVEEGNPYYSGSGNCLIQGTELWTGCKNSSIPSGVTQIKYEAFAGCAIVSVDIPATVAEIQFAAFENCSKLIRINFAGTIAEWKAIKKGRDWDRNTGDYVVVCSDGSLDKSGTIVE